MEPKSIGTSLAIGREPWLPRFIMHRRLSTARSAQLLTGAIKVARQLERFVRPRFAFLHAGPGMLRLIGLGLVIASLGLMLPLPIPFSNSIPALAVVLLAIGMMEKDGLCVAWPFNCNGHLGLYWSDFRVRCWRFPEALGFFAAIKINFHCCLDRPKRSLSKATAKWSSLAPEYSSPLYLLDHHEIR